MPFKSCSTNSSNFLENLKQAKTNETVFIIGGGSSLFSCIDSCEQLDGQDIICVNAAWTLFPHNSILTHFSDAIWFEWQPEDFLKQYDGYISTCGNAHKMLWDSLGIHSFMKDEKQDVGYSCKPNTLAGLNSGHQAVNIAINMGYSNIALLGFDMNPVTSKSHWHDLHKRKSAVNLYSQWMDHFTKMQEKLLTCSTSKVYNCNYESALKCFEFKDVKDIL